MIQPQVQPASKPIFSAWLQVNTYMLTEGFLLLSTQGTLHKSAQLVR